MGQTCSRASPTPALRCSMLWQIKDRLALSSGTGLAMASKGKSVNFTGSEGFIRVQGRPRVEMCRTSRWSSWGRNACMLVLAQFTDASASAPLSPAYASVCSAFVRPPAPRLRAPTSCSSWAAFVARGAPRPHASRDPCSKPLPGTRSLAARAPEGGTGLAFPARLRGVLFDMDGTLSDSESLHFQAYQIVFAKELPGWSEANGPMTREYYNANMGGKTKLAALAQVLPDTTAAQRDNLCSALEDAFQDLASSELTCLPGVYALLDELDSHNVKKALVTNAPPSEMHFALGALKLSDRFDALVPSAECSAGKLLLPLPRWVHNLFFWETNALTHAHPHARAHARARTHTHAGKPDPEPYLEGLRRLGLDASDCIAFEDSAAGIQSATSARLYTFGLSTSRPPADLM